MRSLKIAFIIMLLGVGFHKSYAQLGIARVWAIDDGERIKRDKITYPAAIGINNPVWDGSRIGLFGGRNEVVAFQLIVQGGLLGATNVNVVLDSLYKDTAPSFTISNQGWNGQPYNYVNRHIEMFVMHYMNINVRSSESFVWWSSARPGASGDPVWTNSDFLGWHGEQLVPFEAPAGPKANGQGGAPFRVNALQNQSVWVDIYVPKTTPPGDYTGSVIVTEGGITRYTIPINLQVYDFTLPDVNHLLQVGLLDEKELKDRHRISLIESASYHDMVKKYMQFGKRHRFNVQRVGNANYFSRHWGFLRDAYTGTLFTPEKGYYGPGQGLGPEMFFIGMNDQPTKSINNDKGYKNGFGDVERSLSSINADTTAWRGYWRTASNAWVDSFATYAPNTLVLKALAEEMSIQGGCGNADTSTFYHARRTARWLRDNPGSGSALPIVMAMNFRPEAKAIISIGDKTKNIFELSNGQAGYLGGSGCSESPTYNPYPIGLINDSVVSWRNAGIRVGLYAPGTRPGRGTNMIDAPAIDQRMNGWMMWKLGMVSYRHWQINKGGETYNGWAKDYRDTGGKTWGDGTFIYAGQEKSAFSGDDRGLAGPIAGVRLKNWRRGMQDYEYLWLAQQLGLDVSNIVNSVVNKCGNQIPQNAPVPLDGWAQRGYQYETARRQLAELISGNATPLPTGTFTATPGTLPVGGGTVTLGWSSPNATTASIDNGIGSVPVSGSLAVFVDTSKTFVLTLNNAHGTSSFSTQVTIVDINSQTPFSGSPFVLPGTIQAEDFDNGDEGIAYSDFDPSNLGGVYRATGVDIQAMSDAGGGYNIAWVRGGEWLEYTVDVAGSGTYTIDTRVASMAGGSSIHIEFNGVDKTGPMAIPATGGWQTWQTISKSGVELDSGQQVMRIVADNIGSATYKGNINFISVTFDGQVPVTNLIRNPSFESGTSDWTFYTDRAGSFSSEGPGVDGSNAARIHITRQGNNVQLYQSDVSLQSGVRYLLTFSAYSSTGHNLSLWAHKQGSPYTNYGLDERVMNLTTSWRAFSIQFTASGFSGTVDDARIRFWLAPYDASGDNYYIDNVVLARVSEPGAPAGGPAKGTIPVADLPVDFSLDENYPNPFNPSTTILYSIPEEAEVSIGVYDILGRLVIQLMDEHQPVGNYRVVWQGTNGEGRAVASGLYFYKMNARGSSGKTYSSLKKMVLTK